MHSNESELLTSEAENGKFEQRFRTSNTLSTLRRLITWEKEKQKIIKLQKTASHVYGYLEKFDMFKDFSNLTK